MIERKILLGLITSTDYLNLIRPVYESRFLDSDLIRTVASWCVEYYDQYKEAPGQEIQGIYLDKLKKKKITKETGDALEEDILPGLDEEYDEALFNVDHLLDKTYEYFNEQHLDKHNDTVQDALDKGEVDKAKQLASDYVPISRPNSRDLDLSGDTVLAKIDAAFKDAGTPLVLYPGVMGEFINPQLIRGGFVGFLAPEKRGKTWFLMDMAIRASRQQCKVAFFQAGDMTEAQFLRRVGIYLTHKSDQERYTGKQFLPVKDCIHNQLDECNRKERESDFGIFSDRAGESDSFRYKVTFEEILERYKEEPDYSPCYNCKEYNKKPWGAAWVKEVTIKHPVTNTTAKKAVQEYFIDRKRRLKVSTHANGTLSVKAIRDTISSWEKEDDFIPDVVIVDYADLLVDNNPEFRHKQNQIWKDLRGLNQDLHCLMVTATQADAASYEQDRVGLSNFSEDKRKYGHVTAMYGLNQDSSGREKQLGLLYVNELILREGDFDSKSGVFVLQSLKTGRPFMGSYR